MQANELFDRPNTILLDGGMGTMLQAAGLKLGARPEELNITDPALIESIHARYDGHSPEPGSERYFRRRSGKKNWQPQICL